MSHFRKFPDIPPIWFLVSAGCMIAIDQLTAIGSFSWALSVLFGYGIVVLAVSVILWAAVWFHKKKTPIEPHYIPERIITNGPFEYSRNPIYLAMVLILIGVSLIISNWIGFVVAFVFMLIVDRRFIQDEERNLLKKFEKEAQRYFQNTNKWL